jgi:hypothetical protein
VEVAASLIFQTKLILHHVTQPEQVDEFRSLLMSLLKLYISRFLPALSASLTLAKSSALRWALDP